jgi:polyhydroxybutyrate depolymerase
VSLCTVTGGGHTWPGGLPVPSLGYTTSNISATDAMWDFFTKHPLP